MIISTDCLRLLCLPVMIALLSGCRDSSNGGRWHRFSGGGSYIGAGPAISPDGMKLLFSSPRSGHGDLFVHSLETGTTRQLTNSLSYEGDASWSPCSSKIVFTREDENFNGRIWVMDATGENQRPLNSGTGYAHSPTFSPSGDLVAFSVAQTARRAWPTHLYLTNVVTGDTRPLTEGTVCDWQGAFGADDEEIFFTRDDAVMRINIYSGQCDSVVDGIDPVYLPTTGELLFLVQDSDFQIEIWRMNIETGSKRCLTSSGGYKSSVSVSDVSDRIFFLSQPKANGLGTIYGLERTTVAPIFELE